MVIFHGETVYLKGLLMVCLRKALLVACLVEVSAASSVVVASDDEKYVLGASDPSQIFTHYEHLIDGNNVSENSLYFARARELKLPETTVHSQIARHGAAQELTLHSDGLARDVFVSFGDIDATVSDNYLEVAAGRDPHTHDFQRCQRHQRHRTGGLPGISTLAEVMARGLRSHADYRRAISFIGAGTGSRMFFDLSDGIL